MTRHDNERARQIRVDELIVASAADVHPSLANEFRDDAPRLRFQGSILADAYYSVLELGRSNPI